MKKRAVIVTFMAIILALSLAFAQEEDLTEEPATEEPTTESPQESSKEQLAYNWLVSKAIDGNYNNDLAITALSGLALSNVGYEESAKLSANWLLTQKDPKNCFPKGACRTKDTALALMLFDSLAMPEKQDVQEWLEEAQSAYTAQGKWIIEVSTMATGKCTISYDVRNKTLTEEVEVNQGKFPSCSNSNFLDINSCFKSGLLNEPGKSFTVDCSALGGETPIITLLYTKDGTYYIINTVFGSVAELTINNGCYSKTEKGPCDRESSRYVAWALSKVKSPKNINLYLLENYDATSIENNALLYLTLLTKNEAYLDAIKTRQSATDGSFNKDPYQTALAMLALKESPQYSERVEKAKSWLDSKQSDDGSWRQNTKETAMILYAAYEDAALKPEEVKVTAPDEQAENCNEDWVCDADETALTCVDCQELDEEEACNEDSVCDNLDGETAENCATDCSCGDGICDSSEDNSSCSEDCEAEEEPEDTEEPVAPADTGTGFGTILTVTLVVLLALAGLYFAYKKFGKAPEAKPKASPFGQKPGFAPFKSAAQAKPASKPESQLQKSLEEARKLLKK